MLRANALMRVLYVLLLMSFLGACGDSEAPKQPEGSALVTVGSYTDRLKLCEACHGKDGTKAGSGAPFIAGQHFGYLKQAIQSYVNGNRNYAPMREALYAVTLDDVEKLATHFADLDSAWNPSAPKATPKRPVNPKAVAAGKAIATPCSGCHGMDGNSDKPGVPSLAGVEGVYLTSALNAYLNGRRKDAIMINFRHSLSQQDINNLIAYYSTRTRRQSSVPVKGSKAMIRAGKRASKACIGCHGVGGNSFNATYPSLAGQNEPYLKMAIGTYASGHRKDDLMNVVVKGLNEKTIANLAAYFASQKPVAKQGHKPKDSARFDPLGKGAALANTCNGCHGDKGNSNTPGVPRLTGLSQDYLAGAIRAYRDKHRGHVLMNNLAENLTDADAERVALYYVTQKPVRKKENAGKVLVDVSQITEGCNACHGENGRSTDVKKPSLAGQDAQYLQSALQGYAKGKRDNKTMQDAVAELDAKQMKALARFYAAQEPLKPEVRMPSPPEEVAVKCNRCHGEGGWDIEPKKPRLARQQEAYLVEALLAYKNKTREHSSMNAMAEDLSRVEIDALAAYYSKQTAKPKQ
jgi:cytochrome c553